MRRHGGWTLLVGALLGATVSTLAWGYVALTSAEPAVALAPPPVADGAPDGGDDDGGAAAGRLIEIEVRDYEWVPSTITLQQGEPVVLRITSTGEFPHGIWIPDLGVNVDTPPGEVTEVELTPEVVGEFFLGCVNDLCGTEEEHRGMSGTVVVEP